jgi:hypothetical protein
VVDEHGRRRYRHDERRILVPESDQATALRALTLVLADETWQWRG